MITAKILPFIVQGLKVKQRLQPARNFANGTAVVTPLQWQTMNLQGMKEAKKTGYGLEELIRKANCKDYAEFVIFLYDIGALACKEGEMERIVEALDEIDSSEGY